MTSAKSILEIAPKAYQVLSEFIYKTTYQVAGHVVLDLATLLKLTGLISACYFGVAVYRIWFHPLARIPGPFLCKVTAGVWTYKFFRGRALAWQAELHEMYGEIVRVGPNHVSYIKPEAWKDIFKHKQAGFRPNVKTMNEDGSEPPSDHLPLILESSVEGHAAQRKKLNVAFSERAWRDQEPLVYKHIDWLVGELRDHVDASPNGEAELEIARIFDIVVMKTMCSLSLGAEIETFSPDYESSWVPIALGVHETLNKQIALKAYPLVLFMFRLLTPKALLHGFDTHMANCQPFIKSRLENPEVDRPDILGFLLRETKNGMSRRLINVNASMLVMAGMETSSTALKAITYLLVSNPDKLQKLAREVRALPKRSDLNSKNLQTLVYLNAVISEGLRLFPSGQAALAAQRRIAPGGNFVCGEFLPQYTQVFMAAHAMNNSPLFWKAPHEFVPERWIPEETAFSEYHDYDKFQVRLPFGYGPRMCIGKNIAYHELRGVLASLVYEFDLASTRETVEWLYIKSSNVWSKPDLKVRASRR